MKDKLRKISERIDALSLRERLFLLLALGVVITMSWFNLFMESLQQRQTLADQQVEKIKHTIISLEQQVNAISERGRQDPDLRNRQQLKNLERELVELDKKIDSITKDLLRPVQMTQAVRDIFVGNESLILKRMESLPAVGLLNIDATNGPISFNTQLTNVYRHNLIIELQGSFLDTVSYLHEMEQLPWRFFWDSVTFEVEQFPKATVVIMIHTLNMDEGWVGV